MNVDCTSRVCLSNNLGQVCAASTCIDGTQNGQETDVDCGGEVCDPCIADLVCIQDRDCSSGRCRGFRCQEPRCDDQLRNGEETDEDCGGNCFGCAPGLLCDADSDCLSVHCLGGRCAPSSCEDSHLNQGEEGVDCGGPCLPCPTQIDEGVSQEDMFTEDMEQPHVDMDLLDAAPPLFDSSVEDSSVNDMDDHSDMFLPQDQEVLFPDQSRDDGGADSMDSTPPLPDQEAIIQDQEPPLNIDQSISSPDMSSGAPINIDQDQSMPARFDPESSYSPEVFRRDRPDQGCQARPSGRPSGAPPLLLLLLICYALSRSPFTMRRSR